MDHSETQYVTEGALYKADGQLVLSEVYLLGCGERREHGREGFQSLMICVSVADKCLMLIPWEGHILLQFQVFAF